MAFFRCGKNNSGGEIEYKIWTVKIDQSNSNPETCCTYADDAVGMEKGSSAWDKIFGYKPCLFYKGMLTGYLNPDDFTQFDDGSSASRIDYDIAQDVMIEFPRMGLNISTSGDIITVSLTNNPNDENFSYNAHRRGETQKDYFYLGAYLGYVNNKILYSKSSKTPTTSTSYQNFITYAHNRGTGYEIMGFYQWTYIQALYILKYGNLNSQAALGQGYVSGSAAQTTGYCNAKGMCYGNTSSSTDRVKLFGLEDAWGNFYTYLGGIVVRNDNYLAITTDNFYCTNSYTELTNNWENPRAIRFNVYEFGLSESYMKKVKGTNLLGFFPQTSGGSSTTYYSDASLISAPNIINTVYTYMAGGYGSNTDYNGIFRINIKLSPNTVSTLMYARLMYL